jgi:hypothetical protein
LLAPEGQTSFLALPAQPPGQRIPLAEVLDQIEERLVCVEDAFLDVWKGLTDPPVLQSAHQLAKEVNIRPEVEVSVEEAALVQIGVRAGRRPKIEVVLDEN